MRRTGTRRCIRARMRARKRSRITTTAEPLLWSFRTCISGPISSSVRARVVGRMRDRNTLVNLTDFETAEV